MKRHEKLPRAVSAAVAATMGLVALTGCEGDKFEYATGCTTVMAVGSILNSINGELKAMNGVEPKADFHPLDDGTIYGVNRTASELNAAVLSGNDKDFGSQVQAGTEFGICVEPDGHRGKVVLDENQPISYNNHDISFNEADGRWKPVA